MKVLILGATGSIGLQALEVIKKLGHNFLIVGISYNKNHKIAKSIINKYKIRNILCSSEPSKYNCKDLKQLIQNSKPEIVINAVVGFFGLEYSIEVLNSKINLALANKESLVVAGKQLMSLAKTNNVKIIPIDSEHTSLMQLIMNEKSKIKKLFITASGGPFYNFTDNQLKKVTYRQAIKHPKWNMGPKISIDSATLVNKCFEIIEAFWYYNTKKIIALYHPQSLIHSIIQLDNNSYKANISTPDMKISIALAITNFDPKVNIIQDLDFNIMQNLSLQEIDKNKIKPIKWAYEVINSKNIQAMSIIINASNDAAHLLYENKKISFYQIVPIIDWALSNIKIKKIVTFCDIYNYHDFVKKIILEKGNQWK